MHSLMRSSTSKDDLHQYVALPFLRDVFSDAVLEPIKLHVEAKDTCAQLIPVTGIHCPQLQSIA
jgi:predicted HD phosphohydrolase